jgi:hypothetical protein
MGAIKGDIGAIRAITAGATFSLHGRIAEEDARTSLLAEKDFTFCGDPFTWNRAAPIIKKSPPERIT